MQKTLIEIEHCALVRHGKTLLNDVSWKMRTGEAWLVTGPNGGGKAPFLEALAGVRRFSPCKGQKSADGGKCCLPPSVQMVSLEAAARLIQEEREMDDSEYLEGGVDRGRTGAMFIAEALVKTKKDKSAIALMAAKVAAFSEVKLCGVQDILDRGIKYMSTGEIRRTLLARALLSGAQCLIISDPFAGLDTQSRTLLHDFFAALALKQATSDSAARPYVILGLERYVEVPDAITHVLEFKGGAVSFCGTRAAYEAARHSAVEEAKKGRAEFTQEVNRLNNEETKKQGIADSKQYIAAADEPIIEMNHVNVGWDGRLVLRDLSWALYRGEHWLIRGPNGSGKTTFLELITGDNGQVYANDVKMFGKRRGTGETIWDIKARLGIVSYRLHVEYRMVGGTSLLDTVVSGFRDSIGLYGAATDVEKNSAMKWLSVAGFAGRGEESFSSLSYGEQRSILILRAAVKCPEVLILDEPCHGLSEDARRMVLDIMETVAESGKATLLHVTHEADEVLPCEHHILELCPSEEPMYKIIAG